MSSGRPAGAGGDLFGSGSGCIHASVVALDIAVIAGLGITASAAATTIRPFHYHAPEAALVDLRKRIANIRWPEKDTVADRSQGNQLATLQEIVHCWGTDYDCPTSAPVRQI
jgi:Epoxide hydrolase N terminus